MQREYGLTPQSIGTYTVREITRLQDDYRALEQQRDADRQQPHSE